MHQTPLETGESSTQILLADETMRRASVFRWRIWTGRPLLASAVADGEAVALPKAISPHAFPMNFLRAAICFVFATTVSLVVWGFVPFLMLWGIGALLGHRAPYIGGMTAVLTLLVIVVAIVSLVMTGVSDDQKRGVLQWVRAGYAGMALPILMYLTSTSAGEFSSAATATATAAASPAIGLWLGFFGYMYLDIISFGSIEKLLGPFAALQPVTMKASAFVVLTQFLMTASVLYHAFKYFTRRVYATEQFSGTFQELLAHLNENAPAGHKCYVMPLYLEYQIDAAREPAPVEGLFELSRKDVQINMTQQFADANWQFLKPGVFLQCVTIAIALLGLIVSLLPVGTWTAVWLIVGMMVGLTLLIMLLLPALARARETAEKVKCDMNLRQIGTACHVYASEHGRFPARLEQLLELDPSLELALTCPTVRRKRRRSRRGILPTRAAVLQSTRYAYLGANLRPAELPSDTPLIYEHADCHDGTGGNVLYSDGSVKWHDAAGLDQIIASATGQDNAAKA